MKKMIAFEIYRAGMSFIINDDRTIGFLLENKNLNIYLVSNIK